MKVKLIFDAPDELAGVALEPQDFLRMYNERMLGIRLDGIEIPMECRRIVLSVEESGHDYREDFRKQPIAPELPPEQNLEIARRIKEGNAALQKAIEERKKQEPPALESNAPEVKPIDIDDSIRREAKDRRQQHKLAVKFSNRRK